MDPQAALEGARMAADELAQMLDIDQPADALALNDDVKHEAENLLTNFRSLDSWLSQRGLLPEDWQRGREPEAPQHVCGCGFPIIFISTADDTFDQVIDDPAPDVPGYWQHDAAPHLWGDDHEARP